MNEHDQSLIEHAVYAILDLIGEDPTREGLDDMPKRVANFWKEFIEER